MGNGGIYLVWIIIGFPVLMYLSGYMFTRGVLRAIFETLNKMYKNEKKQKEK